MYQKASSHITIGVKPTNPKTYKKGTQGVEKLPNSFVFYFIYHFILQPLGYLVSTLSLSPSPAPLRLSTNPSIDPPSVCPTRPTPPHLNLFLSIHCSVIFCHSTVITLPPCVLPTRRTPTQEEINNAITIVILNFTIPQVCNVFL